MPGRRPWLLAAALALPLAAGADPLPSASLPVVPQLEGESFGSEDGGRVTVARKARFVSGDAELSADLIRMDVAAGTIVAEGNVAYTSPKLRLLGERVSVDARAGLIEAERVRVGRMPAYFFAERFRMDRGEQRMEGVLAWRNEPSDLGMALRADVVRYANATDRLRISGLEPLVAGIPLLHIPHYGQQGYRRLPLDIDLRFRTSGVRGPYVQTTVTAADDGVLGRGMLFDAYGKAGVLVGPAFTYDNRGLAGQDMRWNASLRGGYIRDNSDLPSQPDAFGRIPDPDRHFILASAAGTGRDGLHVAAQVQSVSDPRALPDFRGRWANEAQSPQTFAEVSAPMLGGRGTLHAAGKTDDFQDVVRRLPEARWDLAETAFPDRRLRGRAFLSVARLSESPSEQLSGLDFLATTGSATALEVTRLDGYAGLAQNGTHEDWMTLRPVAGVRSTWWDEGLGGAAVGRSLGQLGVDLEATATGVWETDSAPWGIRGLRHTVRPFLGYRAYPELDGEIAGVPRMDRGDLASLNLPVLDLADRRDADSLTERQAAQVGVRNALETRDARHGTREVLRADLFVDWREQREDLGHDHSLYGHLAWKPADWLELETLVRAAGEQDDTTGSVTWATVRSGDLWTLRGGYADLRGQTDQRQFFAGLELRINSAFRFRVGTVYDLLGDEFLERQAILAQKIGNSWDLEYGLSERRTLGGDNRLSATLRVRLFKF